MTLTATKTVERRFQVIQGPTVALYQDHEPILLPLLEFSTLKAKLSLEAFFLF